MCMGSPRSPRIVQQGPTAEQVRQQDLQLKAYQRQAADQSATFQQQLQAQIDEIAAQTQRVQAQAAAMASTPGQVVHGGYDVDITQGAAAGAQTTETMGQQQERRSALRISPAGVPASAGTGLNIGV